MGKWIDSSQKKEYKWPINTWEKFSAPLAIREMQVKTTKFHFNPVRMTIIKKTNKYQW
jgi:hypothetical protein